MLSQILYLLQPGLQLSAPLLLAAAGGLFSYRAGVFNIALEGFMLVAAYFSVAVAAATGSLWLGAGAGVLSALLLAAFMGAMVLVFLADEVIVGIALNLFAVGLTTYLLNSANSNGGGFIHLDSGLPVVTLPWLAHVPVVNEIINGRDPLVYVSWIVFPLAALMLRGTLFGLRLRAAGESPLAARAAGVSVGWITFASFLLCGFLCGLAGVELALGSVYLFSENMTAGRGIIAFAAVIFGGGAPLFVGLASLLFGFAQALAGVLQIGSRFPPQFVLMTPYIFAIVALTLGRRRLALRPRGRARPKPFAAAPEREGIAVEASGAPASVPASVPDTRRE